MKYNIQYIKTEKTKSVETKYYEGYNCTLSIKKLLFDNDYTIFSIKHKNSNFAPIIIPVENEENFFFDFSQILAGYEDFIKIKDVLTDIENFCEEFLERKEEFKFIKTLHD